jgi:hypothetical protein
MLRIDGNSEKLRQAERQLVNLTIKISANLFSKVKSALASAFAAPRLSLAVA